MKTKRVQFRGFTKFGIKVLWRLQFLEYLGTLCLKFQKARTKIEVVLSLPCWLSQFSWDSQQGRLRTTSSLVRAYYLHTFNLDLVTLVCLKRVSGCRTLIFVLKIWTKVAFLTKTLVSLNQSGRKYPIVNKSCRESAYLS